MDNLREHHYVESSTVIVDEWKSWIVQVMTNSRYTNDDGKTYPSMSWQNECYWTMGDKSPLPMREAAVEELAREGHLVKRGEPNKYGFQEWRLP